MLETITRTYRTDDEVDRKHVKRDANRSFRTEHQMSDSDCLQAISERGENCLAESHLSDCVSFLETSRRLGQGRCLQRAC